MKSVTYKTLNRPVYIALGVITILLLQMAGCTSRIDIFTNDAPQRLVIYGYITTDTTRHSIKITRSTGYFATIAPPTISGAEVTIHCEDNVYILNEDPANPGMYLTDPTVYGEEGKTYTLYVSVDFEGNGQMEDYTATTYLPYAAEVDSISTKESDLFDDMVEILYYGRLSDADENYLSFRIFRNHIAVNDSLKDYQLIDDKYIDKKEIQGVSCYYMDQEEEKFLLTPGDLVTLRVDAITKDYFEFLDNAQSEVWGNNPVFSGPPANVQTNITAIREDNDIPISGYFTAYTSRFSSTIYEK